MSRAIRVHAFGGPEQLVLEEVPDPRPGPGQVRIRVRASGVHLIDAVQRRGGRGGPLDTATLPMIPGREVAGVVDELGAGVDGQFLGRFVVAQLSPTGGGYAELAVADVNDVRKVPAGLDAATAVAMIGTGRTAMAIAELAAAQASDTVLVTAAAGGVGSLLVQLAAASGALVVAAVGDPSKAARPLELGARHAVSYDDPAWVEEVRAAVGPRAVTLVLDGVGGPVGRAALEQASVTGRIVLYGAASGSLTELSAGDLFTRGITVSSAVGARILQRADGMAKYEEAALAAAANRHLVNSVGVRFPLAEAAAAHQAVDSRATVGKVVLIP